MKFLILALGAALAYASAAQEIPLSIPQPMPPPADLNFVDMPQLQVDLVMKAGSDRVYFSGSDHGLSVSARATLAAQARWLLANPMVRAVIEGHSNERDTRDHALAIGERRANAVRDYLISLG
ncbi:MAG: OmpA family protein, partial [Sphingomicrobium sp.]